MAPGGSGSGGALRQQRLLYWCYVLLGAGTLFPWNGLISAADYWEARFPGKHTDRLLTVSYLPINLVVIAAMVRWHASVRPRLRILGGLVGFTLAISAVPLLDLAPATTGSLAALLLLVAACGACDGFAQGALFGEAALLPPQYTQALVSGTAASGVAVSLLRVLTKATMPDTEAGLRHSANVYFILTALVCASCTAVYSFVLPRLSERLKQAALAAALGDDGSGGGSGPAGWKLLDGQQRSDFGETQQQQQQLSGRPSLDVELSFEDHAHSVRSGGSSMHSSWHEQQQQRQPQEPQIPEDEQLELAGQAALLQGQHTLSHSSSAGWLHDRHSPAAGRGGAGSASATTTAASGAAALQQRQELGAPLAPHSLLAVFQRLWRLEMAVMTIYIVTLSIFPGVLAEDVHSAELGSWYQVALLTVFNLGDWAGKSAPALPGLRLSNERVIFTAVMCRLAFIPAFHLAAVCGAGPAMLGLLTALLGTTNGWLTACAMMAGAAVAPPAAAELAGNLMVLFLILGLCIGAACGFLWLL